MIKLGICTGLENAGILARTGFDYIETALNAAAAMSPEEFARAEEALGASGLPCEVMNCMLPGTLRLTGPGAGLEQAEEYLALAFDRARKLGAELIVFGSGASREVPEGFPRARAWRQLGDFLAMADRQAAAFRLRVAIEPLRREECNIVNFVSEALEMAALLDLPQVGVLGDSYHMHQGGEALSALSQAGELLWHVHMARPEGRAFPQAGDQADQRGEYGELFRQLKVIGYQGRVSIEAGTQSLAEDAAAGFALLDRLRRFGHR